jgi:ATP-dependent DNA ligase
MGRVPLPAVCDGDTLELQSKAGKPLPELVVAARTLGAPRFVLDGEIVVPVGNAFSFDKLLQRIHPAARRVSKLAAETPAMMIMFDLLI